MRDTVDKDEGKNVTEAPGAMGKTRSVLLHLASECQSTNRACREDIPLLADDGPLVLDLDLAIVAADRAAVMQAGGVVVLVATMQNRCWLCSHHK